MREIFVTVVLLALVGCQGAITGQGAFVGLGQGSTRSCSEPAEGEEPADECTIMQGSAISVPGAQIFSGVIALAAGLTSKIFGVPLAPVAAEK